jgi:microcystin-dependent protein
MARSPYIDVVQIPVTINSVRASQPLDNIRVSVYRLNPDGSRQGALPTLYTSRAGAGTKSNPFLTDTTGAIEFWADAGQYEVELVDQNATKRMTDRTAALGTAIGFSAVPGIESGIPAVSLPGQGAGLVPAGTFFPFLGAAAPAGYLMCDGTAVSRTTYAGLFAVIGTTFGQGDGTTTFNLPDMKGRVPVGEDASGIRISNASGRTRGQAAGAERQTLVIAEIPFHQHNEVVQNGGGASQFITGPAPGFDNSLYGTNQVTQGTGGGGSHNNMQPYLVSNYIVKV